MLDNLISIEEKRAEGCGERERERNYILYIIYVILNSKNAYNVFILN
jgi:hypothetical protein